MGWGNCWHQGVLRQNFKVYFMQLTTRKCIPCCAMLLAIAASKNWNGHVDAEILDKSIVRKNDWLKLTILGCPVGDECTLRKRKIAGKVAVYTEMNNTWRWCWKDSPIRCGCKTLAWIEIRRDAANNKSFMNMAFSRHLLRHRLRETLTVFASSQKIVS